MLAHRVREVRARFDVLPDLDQRALEDFVLLLRREDLQALHEGQAGVDHDRELTREDRHHLRWHSSAELRKGDLFALFLDRGSFDALTAQHRDRRIFVVGCQNSRLCLSRPCPLPLKSRHRFLRRVLPVRQFASALRQAPECPAAGSLLRLGKSSPAIRQDSKISKALFAT